MLNKYFKPVALMLMLGFGISATASAQSLQMEPRDYDGDDHYDQIKIDRYLDVEIWSDHTDGDYYAGDNVTLFYRVNRDAFVVIYSIDSRGRVDLLFPSHPGQDNYVVGGVTHRLPDGNDEYDLVVNGPEGAENIQIIASRERFNVPDWYPNSGLVADWDDRHEYMDWLNGQYFVRYGGQRFAYDRTALYINEWEPHYFQPVYDPYYPSWTVSGNVYLDYWYGSSVYIDGLYWGCAPLYIPRLYVGWHTFSVYDHYGYGWEHDVHVTRYNTVVLDNNVIVTSPNIRSKYKKVRFAAYQNPVNAGYTNYEKKVKSIKASGAWQTRSIKNRAGVGQKVKQTKSVYTDSKRYARGSSKVVKTNRGIETAGTAVVKGKRGSYGKSQKASKGKSDRRVIGKQSDGRESAGGSYIKTDRSQGSSGYKRSERRSEKNGRATEKRKFSGKRNKQSQSASGKYKQRSGNSSKARISSRKSGSSKRIQKSGGKKAAPAQKSVKNSSGKKSGGSSSGKSGKVKSSSGKQSSNSKSTSGGSPRGKSKRKGKP